MAPKLLIAAGGVAARPDDLPDTVMALIDHAGQIMVVAPRLPSALEWLSSDTDKATEHADERLQAVLGHLEGMGADAAGSVGADDPLTALEDAIRQFGPDHLLIALRPEDRSDWQERGLLDGIQESFGLPTTVFQLRPA